ncbi:MAG TPA: hypothetical protein PKA63_11765 [Oligoflexia bacterium]|nr:hypothetical protein [Oligoflexia bacterium]HMP49330.1 hypothetical protein [Oligoflexia bacterium]
MKEKLSLLTAELRSRIEKADSDKLIITEDATSRRLTTFGVGGNVSFLVSEVGSFKVLSQVISFFRHKGILPRFLGNGSNLVIPDAGIYSSPVIRLGGGSLKFGLLTDNLKIENTTVDSLDHAFSLNKNSFSDKDLYSSSGSIIFRVHGGSPLMGMSRVFSGGGLSGLEFAAGIPGSLGGGIRMNAGAHGEELEKIILRVFTLDNKGSLKIYEKDDLVWSYRKSSIPPDDVILAADIVLAFSDRESTEFKRKSALSYRKKTQPLQFPSAGSVFRNPEVDQKSIISSSTDSPTISAGALLERNGLKGYALRGVSFSHLHANWIIVHDPDLASSSDICALVEYARELIIKREQISLTPEVLFWDS